MKCLICNKEIKEGEKFCENCSPKINNQQNNTGIFYESEMTENSEKSQTDNLSNQFETEQKFTFESNQPPKQQNNQNLIDVYIGKNADKLKDGNFSWCTLIFGLPYVFYRKMWLLGFAWLLINIALIVIITFLTIKFPIALALIEFGNISISSIIAFISSLIVNIVIAVLFKKLYIKKVTMKVEEIKQKNIGKTNEELVKICSKKGGTSIFGILVPILLMFVLPTLIATIISMNTLNKVNQSVAEDTAHSIISSVELAYVEALLVTDNDLLTIEDIKKEYSGKFSTWNDDNTITPKQTNYDFVCNVKVNSNNKMQVSCDVNGKIIESELFSLGKGNTDNNEENKENDDTEKNNSISYKVVEEPYIGNSTYKHLYVNDKLVDFADDVSSVKVQQLADVLIVQRSLSSKILFVVDKNANVIGVFNSDRNYSKEYNILLTKLTYRDTYRIDGNDIYVQTDQLGNTRADYVLCNNIINDNEVVVYEEKFTYLGNNKFSNPIVTKQITRKQYMQEHNITCNNNQNIEDVIGYNNWIDYILGGNIKSISIKSCGSSENISNINKEDLTKILYELKKGKVVKHYYGGMGNVCNSVVINYSTDKEYTLELLANKYVKTEDKKVLSLLELEDYTVEVSVSSPDYMFRYDWDDKIINTIIDINNNDR